MDTRPLLQGWIEKEKRTKSSYRVSRKSNTTRRWFTIESSAPKSALLPSGIVTRNRKNATIEATLSYYKSPSSVDRSGWIFLSDVTSIRQITEEKAKLYDDFCDESIHSVDNEEGKNEHDDENKDISKHNSRIKTWICIKHPTREFRLRVRDQNQHRIWFEMLTQLCINAKKEEAEADYDDTDEVEATQRALVKIEPECPKRKGSMLTQNMNPATTAIQNYHSRNISSELDFLRQLNGNARADDYPCHNSHHLASDNDVDGGPRTPRTPDCLTSSGGGLLDNDEEERLQSYRKNKGERGAETETETERLIHSTPSSPDLVDMGWWASEQENDGASTEHGKDDKSDAIISSANPEPVVANIDLAKRKGDGDHRLSHVSIGEGTIQRRLERVTKPPKPPGVPHPSLRTEVKPSPPNHPPPSPTGEDLFRTRADRLLKPSQRSGEKDISETMIQQVSHHSSSSDSSIYFSEEENPPNRELPSHHHLTKNDNRVSAIGNSLADYHEWDEDEFSTTSSHHDLINRNEKKNLSQQEEYDSDCSFIPDADFATAEWD